MRMHSAYAASPPTIFFFVASRARINTLDVETCSRLRRRMAPIRQRQSGTSLCGPATQRPKPAAPASPFRSASHQGPVRSSAGEASVANDRAARWFARDERADDHHGQHELHICREAALPVPAKAIMKELSPAWTQ